MMISDVLTKAGRNKKRKRIGRGIGSGSGKTSGRGHKGLGARAGGTVRRLTEGGQMPMFRRLPKRGFSNARFRTQYQVVNVADLQEHYDDGSKITPVELEKQGLIRDSAGPVKILGNGEITKKFNVEATCFSTTAATKITKVGGNIRSAGQV
ncbi:MAG: 50S ribosomal protein L15 [Phycisphaerales bacterium]|nr:50S ribosomal protein L15 [Phycisphaerales bacterium]